MGPGDQRRDLIGRRGFFMMEAIIWEQVITGVVMTHTYIAYFFKRDLPLHFSCG